MTDIDVAVLRETAEKLFDASIRIDIIELLDEVQWLRAENIRLAAENALLRQDADG